MSRLIASPAENADSAEYDGRDDFQRHPVAKLAFAGRIAPPVGRRLSSGHAREREKAS